MCLTWKSESISFRMERRKHHSCVNIRKNVKKRVRKLSASEFNIGYFNIAMNTNYRRCGGLYSHLSIDKPFRINSWNATSCLKEMCHLYHVLASLTDDVCADGL